MNFLTYQLQGHWKRSCPKYLEDLKINKAKGCDTLGMFMIELHSTSVLDTGCGTQIFSNFQGRKGFRVYGLKGSRTIKHGELNLIIGNKMIVVVTKIGDFELVLSIGLSIKLLDCCYLPKMARNIISFHALYKDGFEFQFDNDNGCIFVYKNGYFYFKATFCNGVYESVIYDSDLAIHNQFIGPYFPIYFNSKRLLTSFASTVEAHGLNMILESFDSKLDEECESFLLGKMTKVPFEGKWKCDLLDLIHTNVFGPFTSTTRNGERYFVTFITDSNRYGFIYLMKNKLDTFEVFNVFKTKGVEYLTHEFNDYLKDCGIISQLSPPRTLLLNGVAERRNRMLLDMGYALETSAHIFNFVPTKKYLNTPSEYMDWDRISSTHIKVCEVFVWCKTNDKLEPRAEKYRCIGYPYKSFGYIFYKPSENKVFVARRGVFLERELISKVNSRSNIDFEEIQETTNMMNL
ncbi:LOW QUALITY PROTEIN: hypothetical protein OSB04_031951 [Centaurea solstitialis]|uniref:Retroviral polymerase SH3-like domain-containing protein n=1 Tax=Centaurea solstitialis TaxID=347529 RepID=A0AA38SBD9_9ASTR|nr:LOW QUALITY PROTEIN: hypothetical protein OSB04_031951 [Centaurea solstitialis]